MGHEQHTPASSTAKKASSKSNLPYPDAFKIVLKDLQKFIGEIIQTKCNACHQPLMYDFKVSQWFEGWLEKNRSGRSFSICSTKCSSPKCQAKTCVGCGHAPRMNKFTADCNGLKLDWCCEDGRLFAFWVALCKYDEMELENQTQSAANMAAHSAKDPPASRGTGYAGRGTAGSMGWDMLGLGVQSLYGMGYGGGWSGGRMVRSPQSGVALNFQQADAKTDPEIGMILSLIIELLPISVDGAQKLRAPPALRAMIELSLLSDKVADMLRNDSLRNITTRSEVYYPVLEFVNRLGNRSKTDYLVCDQRFSKKRSSGLQALSASESFTTNGQDLPIIISNSEDDKASSVVGCMSKLAAQAKMLLKNTNANSTIQSDFGGTTGKAMIRIATKVDNIYNDLAPHSYEQKHLKTGKDNVSLWDAYHDKNRMLYDSSIQQHLCAKVYNAASYVRHSQPGRVRRIVSELVEMSTGLPQYIFVKAHESLPHIIKCLIVGPDDTPYEGGLFEFDICCPWDYPNSSPEVQIVTTGRGTIWFNPNLYADVCLSLLGTWSGPPESQWQGSKSTLQQVLTSIHAMIFTIHPYENEPSFATASTTMRSRNHEYNQQCQALTLRYAVLDWLQRPEMRNGPWKDIVANYFRLRGDKMLATARKWAISNHCIEGFPSRLGFDSAGAFRGLPRRPMFGTGNGGNLIKELEVALRASQSDGKA